MKEFSEFEKKIIRRIIELDDKSSLNVLGNILSAAFAEFSEYYIKVESPAKCSVQIEEDYLLSLLSGADQTEMIKEILEGTSRKIFITVKLIEYLETHDIIYSSGESTLRDIGMKIHEGKYSDSTPFDSEISEFLYKYSSKTFLPSESLRLLIKNNFISDEEVRHRKLIVQYNKTIKYSAAAVCVSLLAVFVSAFVPVTTKTKVEPYTPIVNIKIQSKELEHLNRNLEIIQKSFQTDSDKKKFEQEQAEGIIKISDSLLTELKNIRLTLEKIEHSNKGKDIKAKQSHIKNTN